MYGHTGSVLCLFWTSSHTVSHLLRNRLQDSPEPIYLHKEFVNKMICLTHLSLKQVRFHSSKCFVVFLEVLIDGCLFHFWGEDRTVRLFLDFTLPMHDECSQLWNPSFLPALPVNWGPSPGAAATPLCQWPGRPRRTYRSHRDAECKGGLWEWLQRRAPQQEQVGDSAPYGRMRL